MNENVNFFELEEGKIYITKVGNSLKYRLKDLSDPDKTIKEDVIKIDEFKEKIPLLHEAINEDGLDLEKINKLFPDILKILIF